jgi:uncharacterized ParB-like nuclease family protein
MSSLQRGRQRIVELEPGDLITFRMKGKRQRYTCSLWACERVAIMQHLINDHKRKSEEAKAGLRKRKPKPLSLSAFERHLQLALR